MQSVVAIWTLRTAVTLLQQYVYVNVCVYLCETVCVEKQKYPKSVAHLYLCAPVFQ